MYSTIQAWLKQRVTKIQIFRFLISLLLATLLWGWVTQLQDPMRERTFSAVPVTVAGLSDSLILVTTLPTSEVQLSGPESEIEDVRVADLTLTLDLSHIDAPGNYRVRLNLNKPDGVDTESIRPSEVQVQIEEEISKQFQLKPESAMPEDDPRRISSVTPSVSQVTVTGPSSSMGRVAQVILPVTLNQEATTFEGIYQPVAIDAQGQRITDVRILPEQVSAVVELETRGKQISVIPVVTGIPAEGYSVQQKSVVPETILVDGPEEILNSLLFVNTEPVDITGATASVSQQVGIADLPEGVQIVDPANGEVELRVAIEDTTNTSQVIPAVPIEVQGLDSAYTATVDPAAATITIDASQSVLQSLVVSDIQVHVSADGLEPGTYQLQVDVTLPDGVTLVASDQQIVQVTISDARASPAAGTPTGG